MAAAADGDEMSKLHGSTRQPDRFKGTLASDAEPNARWESVRATIERDKHHCVILVGAHGLTIDTGKVETRGSDPKNYPAVVNVYSTVGEAFGPGLENVMEGTDITNYLAMPTAVWSIFNRENRGLKTPGLSRENQISTIKSMVNELGHRIESFNAEAGIKYQTPPVLETNPAITRKFYMFPNRNETHRHTDAAAAAAGIRSLPQRTCADLGFLKEHGMVLFFTTKPEHKNLSLAEISPANLRRHKIVSFSDSPFVTPTILKNESIFGRRRHKYFEKILINNGIDPNLIDGAIQILRRGVMKQPITLQELSLLINRLGYTSFTLIDGSCRTLRRDTDGDPTFVNSLDTNSDNDTPVDSLAQEDPAPVFIPEIPKEPYDKLNPTSFTGIFQSIKSSCIEFKKTVFDKKTAETLLSGGWWRKQIASWMVRPRSLGVGGSINTSRKSTRTRIRTRTRTRVRTNKHTRKHKKRYTTRRWRYTEQ